MSAKESVDQGRRSFLKASAALGGGVVIGFHLPAVARLAEAAEGEPRSRTFVPNGWLRIAPDDSVTIIVAKSEMGQGVMTAMPMLVAEELEADWTLIRVEQAPAEYGYINPMLGMQVTGASTSVRSSWVPLREAGAMAREMLIAAAASQWGVAPSTCRADNGRVIHAASGRSFSYGALAEKAASLPPVRSPQLKQPKDFRILGKPLPRLDAAAKVDGTAVFGMDVQVPGMLIATIVHAPSFSGNVFALEAGKTKAMKGVRAVVELGNSVAVVAEDFWTAKKGADALEIEWDDGMLFATSSASIVREFRQVAEEEGAVVRDVGDAASALAGAARRIEAEYEVPYLAHATMEPMNCTAWVKPGKVELWVATQGQTTAQRAAAIAAGVSPDDVVVHTTFLGGGFGRRVQQDFVTEAVQISKAVRAPVKLIWTREEDIRHDYYRPATYNRLAGGADADGNITAWTHRIVGPSIMVGSEVGVPEPTIDGTSIEGATDMPYAIPNFKMDYTAYTPGIPVGFWRSVGHSQNAFITESFFDELAHLAGRDPFELRRSLLGKHPRMKAVLELAAEKAGWSKPLSAGRHRGIAVHYSFASFVSQVAEVSVSPSGEVRVHRVVCAVDCGLVVNPEIVRQQMESAIVFGLTAALKGEITIEGGVVQQSNFHDYPLLRLDEAPVVDVYIQESEAPPGGVGEPGTPPIAPAVCNAIFAATGKRIRKLPIRPDELRST